MPGTHWADIQQKTFTRWCNDYLSERGMHIDDLSKDLSNGLALINLMEVLSGKSLGRHNKHPRVNMQKMENITIALEFIKSEGIQLVNVGTDDVASGNIRIILGLIWTLILRYEIKGGEGGDKNAINDLLEWVRSKIPEYDIKGFTKDWNDGRAVCALTNALSPGLISDHWTKDPANKLENAEHGLNTAEKFLGVDKLIFADEMTNPKVDKLAMMTYIAQFRNVAPGDIKKMPSDASRCHAYGPGLQEGVADEQTYFVVETPLDCKGKMEVKIEGPSQDIGVQVTPKDNGEYRVTYNPTVAGAYKVHITVGGEHIPGSIFNVLVLESESLGGEGKIRVYFSTTSSSEKSKRDVFSLETLLTGKKVHLRSDFEPWIPVDLLTKEDRDAIFRKAGTRALPIVFIDDQYAGDYDKMMELEELGKLDERLSMKGVKLVSESEHMARLKSAGHTGNVDESKSDAPPPSSAPAGAAPAGGKKFCEKCGQKATGAKFCSGCGNKM